MSLVSPHFSLDYLVCGSDVTYSCLENDVLSSDNGDRWIGLESLQSPDIESLHSFITSVVIWESQISRGRSSSSSAVAVK